MWDLWWTKWHWAGFLRVLRFSPVNIIPPLLHIHLSPPHARQVCDSSDQAAQYHNLGPKLGASLLTRHIGWKQKKKVKKKCTLFHASANTGCKQEKHAEVLYMHCVAAIESFSILDSYELERKSVYLEFNVEWV
jgi:hypothetical protein